MMQRTAILIQCQSDTNYIYALYNHLHPVIRIIVMIKVFCTLLFSSFLLGADGQINEMVSGNGEVYGTTCGIAGTPPPGRISIERLIAEKDSASISGWLFSPSSVKNTYGAEAVLRMSSQGVVFDKRTISRLNDLLNSENKIAYCHGCIHSRATIASLLQPWIQQ